jgi:hypothetical protein
MINIPYYTVFDLAYFAIYQKIPPGNTRLTSPPEVERKTFNSLTVDVVLKDEWLEILCSLDIHNLKIISLSAGHDRSYLSHITFVLLNSTTEAAEILAQKYRDNNIIVGYMTLPNYPIYFTITTKNWYRYETIQDNNSKWRNWWETVVEVTDSIFNGK